MLQRKGISLCVLVKRWVKWVIVTGLDLNTIGVPHVVIWEEFSQIRTIRLGKETAISQTMFEYHIIVNLLAAVTAPCCHVYKHGDVLVLASVRGTDIAQGT